MKQTKYTIFIIENNVSDRQFLKKILVEMEYDFAIKDFATGKEAMSEMNIRPPDLVLLNLYLPDQDGFFLLESFHQKGLVDLPVLLVSSFDKEDDKKKGFDRGAIDFINKPIVLEDVKARVACQLRFKRMMDDQKWANQKTNEGIKMLYKELENQNKKLLQLDHLKDDFVGSVSHELRTPLAIMRESISQIRDELFGEVPDQQKRYLDKALINMDRLRNIIDNLLDISKIEKGKLEIYKEKVDLNKLVEEIVSDFAVKAKAKGLILEGAVHGTAVYALVDPEKTIQVFNNLIGNALKFTEKGSIEITVQEEEDFIQCKVKDTGKGIAQKDLHKLFDKFQQVGRKHGPGEKGTGLGLAIAKGIIELHGGNIHVESTEGEGTAFFFSFQKYIEESGSCMSFRSALISAIKQFNQLSVIKVDIRNLKDVDAFKGRITKSLFRKSDRVIIEEQHVFILLPDTEKEMCSVVLSRIKGSHDADSLGECIVSFPIDGLTCDELINGLERTIEGENHEKNISGRR